MTFISDTEIARIYTGLLTRSLPKAEWTHAAHFAAALAMLLDMSSEAYIQMPDTIRAYNLATGVANTESEGYHHTITLASLAAAEHELTRAGNIPLHRVLTRLLEKEYGQPKWLLHYWSAQRLFSASARLGWTAPDLVTPDWLSLIPSQAKQ